MININPEWTYKEVIEHIKDYKAEYQGVLSAFNMWQTKEWADYIITTRNKFYSLNLMEWQIEFLWKYMNNYLDIHKLKLSGKRYK